MTSTALETTSPAALAIRPGQQMWTDKQHAALGVLGLKDASNADLAVFMHVCQNTGLDPFTRQIYGIMRREKQGDQWADRFTIHVGIDGFRVIRDRIAERKGLRVEYEDTTWYDADGRGHEVWLRDDPPAACRVVVLVDGRRFPSVLKFSEYCQVNRDGKPVAQWASKPAHMIEKCAEANGLRRAFPNDMAGVLLEDEVPPPQPAPPRGRVTVAEVTGRQDHAEPAETADEPALASSGQVGLIVQHFKRLGFTDGEREQRLATTSVVVGRDVTSTKELTRGEAKLVRDTLSRCKDRDELIALLVSGEKPDD